MSAQQEYKELYAKYKAAIDQLSTVTAERDRARGERDDAYDRILKLSGELDKLRRKTEASHD